MPGLNNKALPLLQSADDNSQQSATIVEKNPIFLWTIQATVPLHAGECENPTYREAQHSLRS